MKVLVSTLATLVFQPCLASTLPTPSRDDPRIGTVRYNKGDVTTINVQRGTATRILLAPEEKIAKDGAATGFASDCEKPELEWCVHASPGTNQVMVKPKDGATHNNLELRTDLREYSFDFRVLPDRGSQTSSKQGDARVRLPMHRVVFSYPTGAAPGDAAAMLARASAALDHIAPAGNANASPRPIPKNWKYSMQLARGSEDIAPCLVFDDGRFTYFSFPANREIPTIYTVSPQGEEARVNFHIDSADRGMVTVQRMSRRFVLRLGASAVGVWNDAFDSFGAPPVAGTSVPGVSRVVLESK